MTEPKNARVALVTGANQGIGLETARQLAQQGVTVLIGARNETSGQEAERQLQAKGLDVRFIHLDVTDQNTIDQAAKNIETTFGKLDILVNNAGINSPQDGELSTVTEATLREVFGTNFFGTFRVTQAVLPLLKKAEAARIVNVSSSLGSLTLASEPGTVEWSTPLLAYNASKAAMNALTVRLAAELHDTAIKVNSANPGYTASNLNNFQGTQTLEEGAVASVRLALLPDDGPNSSFFSKDGNEPW